MTDAEFNQLIDKLREKALGNTIQTIIEQYSTNEKGEQKLDNRTLKKIVNDIDTQACIKLIDLELKRREIERNRDWLEEMTDEELELERIRLIKELAEQTN